MTAEYTAEEDGNVSVTVSVDDAAAYDGLWIENDGAGVVGGVTGGGLGDLDERMLLGVVAILIGIAALAGRN